MEFNIKSTHNSTVLFLVFYPHLKLFSSELLYYYLQLAADG